MEIEGDKSRKPHDGTRKTEIEVVNKRASRDVKLRNPLGAMVTHGLRIQIQSIGGHRSNGVDPVAFFPFSERGIVSMDLLQYHDRKVFHRMIR